MYSFSSDQESEIDYAKVRRWGRRITRTILIGGSFVAALIALSMFPNYHLPFVSTLGLQVLMLVAILGTAFTVIFHWGMLTGYLDRNEDKGGQRPREILAR